MKVTRFILYAAISLSLVSCLSDDGRVSKLNEEVKLIDDFLAANGITQNVLYDNLNGIRIHVHEYGKWAPPHTGQTVTVNYVGKLFSNGTTFATGPVTAKLQDLSPYGFGVVVSNMMTGSNVTAYIPSPSGYGTAGTNNVPPDAILVYDIYIAKTERTATEESRFKQDSLAILHYIEDSETDFQYYSDIWYVIDEQGIGDYATPFQLISGEYKISLLSNPTTILDQSTLTQHPIPDLIDGLRVAIPLLREGSKARFIIPSGLGYGPSGFGSVPGNANLLFEFKLTDIHQ
ncbi:MAG TPA: FKBP-type peptidyl-prolyl cis-trans isomerase [Cyclobacteriaceae bacterium]|jgi:FKBP-type peptidyl-prolyl cis-trans isomerase